MTNAPDTAHFFSPARKRHASGPIPDGELQHGEPVESPALKRRRSNLANGFSTLSISARERQGFSPLPTYQESQELASDKEVDEDDVPGPSALQDVRVEYLPDSPRSRKRGSRRPVYGSSSTSEASGSSSPDSEITYILPAGPSRHHGAPQMPDSIEEPASTSADHFFTEDISDLKPRKRRHHDDDQQRKRRRNDEMDVDMDGTTANGGEAMGDVGGDYNRGRRKERGWYEPEKDRESKLLASDSDRPGIVVTSLSSSRESSVDSRASDKPIHLAQPGLQGFTISPSLLTRLLAEHRNRVDPNLPPEKALVPYKPLLPPGANWDEIVRMWRGDVGAADQTISDTGRFEEISDDVDVQAAPANAVDADMDMSMDIE